MSEQPQERPTRADIGQEPGPGWFIGDDNIFRFHAVTGSLVLIAADAIVGATALTVRPLDEALTSGQVLLFIVDEPERKRFVFVTLGANAAAGASSLTVTAITSALAVKQRGRRLQDVTGWTLEWVLRESAGFATAVLTKATPTAISIAADPTHGQIDLTIVAADTLALAPKRYYHTLRRTGSGTNKVIAEGEAKLQYAATR